MFIYPYSCRIQFCSAEAYSWTDALPGFLHLVKNLENLLESNTYDIQILFDKYDDFFLFFSLTNQAYTYRHTNEDGFQKKNVKLFSTAL